MLSQDKDIYPEALTTGYYGSLTKSAVQRFQCKHMSLWEGSPDTTGYGLAGPATRKKLNEVYGGGGMSVQPQTADRAELITQLKETVRQLQTQLVGLLTQLMEALKERAGRM